MVNQLYHINIYLVIYHVLYIYCHPPQKITYTILGLIPFWCVSQRNAGGVASLHILGLTDPYLAQSKSLVEGAVDFRGWILWFYGGL
jgi:hypothetical protein